MKYILLSLHLFLASPLVHSQKNLANNALLQQYYSADEIDHLSIIADFFDHYIQQQTGIDDLQPAYDAFNKSAAQEKRIPLNIPADSLHAMYAEVDLPVWNSIWQYGSIATRRPGDGLKSIVPQLDLNYAGEYRQFLMELGKTSKLIKMYADYIQKAGTLSPVTFALYFDESQKVDFNDPANRLVAAIHYLTFYERQLQDH